MSAPVRRLATTALLTAAIAVGGLGTAAAASATETQVFTGFVYSPVYSVVLPAARAQARQKATAAGYDPDTQCTETKVRYGVPSPTFPYYSASSEWTCTR